MLAVGTEADTVERRDHAQDRTIRCASPCAVEPPSPLSSTVVVTREW